MSRVSLTTAVALAAALVPAAGAAPAATDAREIMTKNFFVSKVSALKVDSTMVLASARGQRRERRSQFFVKLQPNGIDSKVLIKFSTPADIKGTGVLQIEHSGGDDDLWIYLPALKKSRRLVANNKKDSFAGSDFSYGDITLPPVDDYRHTVLRRETIDGLDCHVIESTPASDAIRSNTGYGRKITWVRADNFLEARVEYYDVSGRLLKTQKTSRHQLVEPDKGRWFALAREMTNHQSGHRTTIDAATVEAVPLADDVFTTRFLERE